MHSAIRWRQFAWVRRQLQLMPSCAPRAHIMQSSMIPQIDSPQGCIYAIVPAIATMEVPDKPTIDELLPQPALMRAHPLHEIHKADAPLLEGQPFARAKADPGLKTQRLWLCMWYLWA